MHEFARAWQAIIDPALKSKNIPTPQLIGINNYDVCLNRF
jgi:hypothetical protein